MPEVKSEIYDGCTVVVQKGTYLKTCRVMAGRTYAFGKRGDGQFTLNIDGALGSQFGSSFRMERMTNKLFSIHKTEHLSNCLDIVKEGGEDNRDLQDDGRSQKLTSEEIIQLKGSGLTGKEVIQTITENSTTFKDKTVFSKEKYVNKKQKKYGEIITIHRPSIRLLSNMYYTQDPLKIADAVDLMNFTVPELEVLSFINFNKLPDINLQEESATNGTEEMKEVSKEEEKQSLDDVCLETKQKKTGGDENMETSGGNAKSLKLESAKPRKFVRRQVEDVQMSSTVLRGSIEGLVVACRQYPNNILRDLLHFLKPGHPFVVFSPYKEPLMELFMEVKSQDGTNVRLSETWLRHYQVLPQRTHPEINMSGGGGYLLYGTRIMKEYNSTNSK
ncbi:tRNA (adenine(58)-N(1))-methyltransferase non-catalytic subunit TRM6 isoform X2 [Procambarus clarkii]|uniref:tRNA (adenine(58)-N(1))-methyltransferase non-catalytic subunit TRM6 isoform X2 n=1 Tax=Procambarus clarkii TaxID=6728 RepID=UPI003742865D